MTPRHGVQESFCASSPDYKKRPNLLVDVIFQRPAPTAMAMPVLPHISNAGMCGRGHSAEKPLQALPMVHLPVMTQLKIFTHGIGCVPLA